MFQHKVFFGKLQCNKTPFQVNILIAMHFYQTHIQTFSTHSNHSPKSHETSTEIKTVVSTYHSILKLTENCSTPNTICSTSKKSESEQRILVIETKMKIIISTTIRTEICTHKALHLLPQKAIKNSSTSVSCSSTSISIKDF